MTDLLRSQHRGARSLECVHLYAVVKQCVGDLRLVGDLNASQSLARSHCDAFLQPLTGTGHSATHVFGIPEAAQRCGLKVRPSRLAGEMQAHFMLAVAAREVALREIQIAPQEMQARPFRSQPIFDRALLRTLGDRRMRHRDRP